MSHFSRFFIFTDQTPFRWSFRNHISINKDKRVKPYAFILTCTRLFPAEVLESRELGINSYFFPVCPNCDRTLEREYQSYCDRCGQKLAWNLYDQQFSDEDIDF